MAVSGGDRWQEKLLILWVARGGEGKGEVIKGWMKSTLIHHRYPYSDLKTHHQAILPEVSSTFPLFPRENNPKPHNYFLKGIKTLKFLHC